MSETELLQILLKNRGIEEKAEEFLNPDYERDLGDPYLLTDMERAVVRIFEAIEGKQKILIYGDYDCDGIPGTVILYDLLNNVYPNAEGGRVEVYIPDRHEEGFGLHREAIHKFKDDGVNLIITVDLGITDVVEVALAQGFGIDVIVTDHHLPAQAGLPPAYAILNPKRPGDKYPFKDLCGAGVAFKLAQAFIKKYGGYFKIQAGWEKWLLDMAGIATLSDMVPLLGENRALAYFGLKVLRKNRRPGLQKIFANLNIDACYLVEDDITFMLAPRLNAASRMDNPRRAFELLSTDSELDAGALATHLAKINNERKILVATTIKEIKKTMEKREEKKVIVLGNPLWRAGILGLVASKVVEEYKKPCFVWGSDMKGSCRGDGSINVVELMSLVKNETLSDFGGHAQAGGFSVSREQVHFLEEELLAAYDKLTAERVPTQATSEHAPLYDVKLLLSDINQKNYGALEKLAPFGLGNPKPIFLFENVEISQVRQFGKKNDHLELMLTEGVKAIAFFKDVDSFIKPLTVGQKINLLANFEKSIFRNKTELRLRIVDIIFS